MAVLVGAIRDRGLATECVDVQLANPCARDCLKWVRLLPDGEVVDCDSLKDAMRAVKTEDETATIEDGASTADECYQCVRTEARVRETDQCKRRQHSMT